MLTRYPSTVNRSPASRVISHPETWENPGRVCYLPSNYALVRLFGWRWETNSPTDGL